MCLRVTSARYGFDRARLLAIHTRLTNHIPRGSRYKEKTISESLTLPVVPQKGSDIPFGQSSSCIPAADSFPESNTAVDLPLGKQANTQHDRIVPRSALALPNCEPSRNRECTQGFIVESTWAQLPLEDIVCVHLERVSKMSWYWLQFIPLQQLERCQTHQPTGSSVCSNH